MSWETKVKYQGKTLNYGTFAMMTAANKMLATKKFGGENGDITLVQGSYSGGVSASAGTHNGGGAIDITAYNWKNREKVFRLLGMAMWHRPTLPGVWSAHMHGIVCGDGTASAGAKAQVNQYYDRKNGLANRGKDEGYRMDVFPLFVNPEKAIGKPGKIYCIHGTHLREQPTTRAKSLGTVKVGGTVTIVAVVNVNKVYWGITADGKCVLMKRFSRNSAVATKPPAPEKKPAPAPAPTAKSVGVNIGNINVIRWRLGTSNPRGVADFKKGRDYTQRVNGLAKTTKKIGVSVFTTQESGQYADANLLDQKLNAKAWSNRLHGDEGDLTNAIHWHKKRKEITGGKFVTSGSHHNWGVWSLLQDVKTGIYFMVVTSHLEYRERGTKGASVHDKTRETQARKLIETAEALSKQYETKYKVKNIPIIFTGDFNSDKDDVYDGPGRAFADKGYVDAEDVCKKQTNSKWATYNQLKTTPFNGRRLDRIFVKKGEVKINNLRTRWAAPSSDHNYIAAGITVTNS